MARTSGFVQIIMFLSRLHSAFSSFPKLGINGLFYLVVILVACEKMEIYDEWILLSNNSCTKMQQRIPIISGKALEPSKPEVISQGRWSMKGDTIIILLPIKDDPKHRLVSKLMITENGLVVCGSGQRLEKVKENTQ